MCFSITKTNVRNNSSSNCCFHRLKLFLPSTSAIVFLFIILNVITCPSVSADPYPLRCYQCTTVPPAAYTNKTTRLCSKFDYSQAFIVTCPYSTMCMKKSFEYKLQNGDLVTGEMRDCAPQKYEYQEYSDRQWKMKARVEEAYPEGCQQTNDKGLRVSKTEYCYCRDQLCNGSTSIKQSSTLSYHTDTIAVIVVFNIMKYMRSF